MTDRNGRPPHTPLADGTVISMMLVGIAAPVALLALFARLSEKPDAAVPVADTAAEITASGDCGETMTVTADTEKPGYRKMTVTFPAGGAAMSSAGPCTVTVIAPVTRR